MKRRWEVWVLNTENGQPVEDKIASCFTRLGARFRRHVAETDHLTPIVLMQWNAMWPDNQLGIPRYEIRRAS